MAKFFIDRPIFAWVIAIIIMLAGALSMRDLPLEQYPDIAPVRISVSATYTGANAETVEDSVTQVIEQQMKGLDGLQYMQATSTSSGQSSVQLSFVAGTNSDVAQMQVQNKMQQALTMLPTTVQEQGVTTSKSGTDILLIANLVSDDPNATSADLGDYVASTLQDTLNRVDGVGDVLTLGSSYAMRVWLDPTKLQKYALMPSDIESALTAQNTQVSAGQLGGLPAASGQQINAVISARSKLHTVAEFKNIVVKSGTDGSIVRLSDVARVELGSQSYTYVTRYNGRAAAGIGIKLADGANALQVAKDVKAKLKELSQYFPKGMHYVIGYDTTPFVTVSVEEVVKTLLEAMVLVVIIMVLFMQNLRATLIPAIAVPVVLLGTFGIVAVLGYSINTLVLFGMVLAIGLLVDDAIVVVENVERVMTEENLSPKEATRKSMGEITGALVGISLVLSAVFIPMAFFSGSTGVIYRQFSVTIVSAMALSVLVALTLTPALCATILRSTDVHGHGESTKASPPKGAFGRFFAWFNRSFERLGSSYEALVKKTLGRTGRMFVIYTLLLAGLAVGFKKLPTSFLPVEDQGTIMAMVQLPPAASAQRTIAVLKTIEDYVKTQPEVTSVMGSIGQNGDQASANMYIRLKDWSERTGSEQGAQALADRFTKALSGIRDARIYFMLPPAIRGLGSAAGFTFELKDVGGVGHNALMAARDQFLEQARKDPLLSQIRPSGLDDAAQLKVTIDDAKASALSLDMSDINDTLSAALGGQYVNDFIDQARLKKVYIQGDAPYRMQPSDINNWYVRNSNDDMVPFSAFASTSWETGPAKLERYNGVASVEIVGSPATGVSSGVAMAEVEKIIAKLPTGIGYEWSAQSYQERLSGSQAPSLYAISVLFVFLCLAALYESWSLPFSVILVVPLGVIGAVYGTWIAGLTNDVYFQIGLLTTVGLSAKNAILIVEFAQSLHHQGASLVEATLQAVRMRLRPILMTSLAFGFGVLPLAIATGAASGSRRDIGTGVLGGMITATILGLIFVPVFYVAVRRLFSRKKDGGHTPPPSTPTLPSDPTPPSSENAA